MLSRPMIRSRVCSSLRGAEGIVNQHRIGGIQKSLRSEVAGFMEKLSFRIVAVSAIKVYKLQKPNFGTSVEFVLEFTLHGNVLSFFPGMSLLRLKPLHRSFTMAVYTEFCGLLT